MDEKTQRLWVVLRCVANYRGLNGESERERGGGRRLATSVIFFLQVQEMTSLHCCVFPVAYV